MPQTASTRWCPTPEQLMILEEMYRSGVTTPNASQIQQITAHLSFYGKIEGKNVFYWFQNHKARDRQKLRRRLSHQYHLLHGFTSTARHPHRFHNLEEVPLTPTFDHHSQPLHFLHQGAPDDQEATQGMNLLCKLEAGNALAPLPASAATYSFEWMMMTTGNSNPCCRPLKTLDLFPTMSTGFKDEYSTSKFSS